MHQNLILDKTLITLKVEEYKITQNHKFRKITTFHLMKINLMHQQFLQKTTFSIFFSVFFVLNNSTFSQPNNHRLQIDTLKTTNDSILVLLSSYQDTTLMHEEMGYLFRDSSIVPRFKIFPFLFKKNFHFIRVVKQGETTEYFPDGSRKVFLFENDLQLKLTTFDKNNSEISNNNNNLNDNIRGPCGSNRTTIIIEGKKK